jgi:hypothetical protein
MDTNGISTLNALMMGLNRSELFATVKLTLEQAIMAQRGSTGIALLFL